jgi:selenocysteine-specific elongation factor
VALTKIDAAPDDVAELAAEEARDLLSGTSLARAPVVPVSAQSGEGIEELRAQLAHAVQAAAPRTSRTGPARLCVDRTFAMKGFGSVVTGTLVGSALSVGDAVEIQPSGLRARVRGLQSHGQTCERVEPGTRCAVNFQNVDLERLSRGQVVATPGALEPTGSVDVQLHWLAAAPRAEGSVAVEFLSGTSDRRAQLAPIGADEITPGSRAFARLHIDGEPVPLLPGDRFIVRGFARNEMGGATLGGGVILDVAPPHRRRSDPALARDLERLSARNPRTDLAVRIERSGFAGVPQEHLRRQTGLAVDALERELEALASSGAAVKTAGGTWLESTILESIESRLEIAMDAYHQAEPIRPGMARGALRGRLPDNVPRDVAERALERLTQRGVFHVDGDLVWRAGHEPKLAAEDRAAIEKLVEGSRAAGLDPPSLRDWSERLGIDSEHLLDLLAHCERMGQLVRAPGDLWFDRDAVDHLRERVVSRLREHASLDTKSYKSLIGTTRRTAVPLMELFDAEHITIRRGETRVLR